jgi:hypothetical protein
MATCNMLSIQAARPFNHVKHAAVCRREQAVPETRTRAASTAIVGRTAVRNPDHLLSSLETLCNGKVRVTAHSCRCLRLLTLTAYLIHKFVRFWVLWGLCTSVNKAVAHQ